MAQLLIIDKHKVELTMVILKYILEYPHAFPAVPCVNQQIKGILEKKIMNMCLDHSVQLQCSVSVMFMISNKKETRIIYMKFIYIIHVSFYDNIYSYYE